MEITAAKLRYLLTLSELEQDSDRRVRCIDIAVRLGVARPSACRMLAAFSEEGLLSRDKSAGIRLTAQGRELVSRYEEEYKKLSRYFQSILSLSEFDARECAMALLVAAPDSSRSALCANLPSLP